MADADLTLVRPTVAVVTGASRGIGYEIVRRLALEFPKVHPNRDLVIFLTANDIIAGLAAVERIYQDEELAEAKVLCNQGGRVVVWHHRLDLLEIGEQLDFVEELLQEHHTIDILINNASVCYEASNVFNVSRTLQINFRSPADLCSILGLRFNRGGTIVNLSCRLADAATFSDERAQELREATTHRQLNALMTRYREAVDADRVEEEGWSILPYIVSKALLVAFTRVLVNEEILPDGVSAWACCPGVIRGGNYPEEGQVEFMEPSEAAKAPVMLALGTMPGIAEAPNGSYWIDGEVVQW